MSPVLNDPVGRVSLHPEVPVGHRHLLEVVRVAAPTELVQAAVLLGEYRSWMEDALGTDVADYQPEARSEYADPGEYYAAPHGALLLARVDGDPAGVMGVHLNEPELAELKRGFVRRSARGLGVLRALFSRGLSSACTLGARTVFLETSPRHSPSVSTLAHSFGFEERRPLQFAGHAGAVRMELTLDCIGSRRWS